MRSDFRRQMWLAVGLLVVSLSWLASMCEAAARHPKILLHTPGYWLKATSPLGTWFCLQKDEPNTTRLMLWNATTRIRREFVLQHNGGFLPINESRFALLSLKPLPVQTNVRTQTKKRVQTQIKIMRYDSSRVLRVINVPIFAGDYAQDWNISANRRELRLLASFSVYRFDLTTGKLISRQPWGEANLSRENAPWSEIYKLSPDARTIVGMSLKHRLMCYDARTGKRLKFSQSYEVGEDILAVSFTHNPMIMQCNEAGETSYRRLPDGKKLWRWEPDTILSTRDGRYAAAILPDGLELRDLRSGKRVSKHKEMTDKENALVFSSNGLWAYTTDSDGTLKQWRLK